MSRAGYVFALALLCSCATGKQVARTAIDAARIACDLFLAEQPEPERLMGMTLDQCADQLLAAQRRQLAVARGEAP